LYSEKEVPPEINDFSVVPLPLVRAADGKQIARVHFRCRGVRKPIVLWVDPPSGPVQEMAASQSTVLNGEFDAEIPLDPVEHARDLKLELNPPVSSPLSLSATVHQRPVRHFEL